MSEYNRYTPDKGPFVGAQPGVSEESVLSVGYKQRRDLAVRLHGFRNAAVWTALAILADITVDRAKIPYISGHFSDVMGVPAFGGIAQMLSASDNPLVTSAAGVATSFVYEFAQMGLQNMFHIGGGDLSGDGKAYLVGGLLNLALTAYYQRRGNK